MATAPFRGYKMSGYGREPSVLALDICTLAKSIWIDFKD
jgi:acyl-CoA reductase-like NAD-dependent aldehyde dehydrogenase